MTNSRRLWEKRTGQSGEGRRPDLENISIRKRKRAWTNPAIFRWSVLYRYKQQGPGTGKLLGKVKEDLAKKPKTRKDSCNKTDFSSNAKKAPVLKPAKELLNSVKRA